MKSSEQDEMLDLKTAADFLKISERTAWKLAKEYLDTGGESGLPCRRVGTQYRLVRSQLVEYVRGEL